MILKRKRVKEKKAKTQQPLPRVYTWLVWFLLFCLIVGFLGIWHFSKDVPSFDQLENFNPELATKVYSADGKLIKEFYTQRRFFTPLEDIPPLMLKAVLSTEDHRFYEHWGVSPLRFIFVTVKYLTTGSKQQGSSTLTMQLARRLYLTPEKNVTRKIKEVITSIQLERAYTKNEILEMYVNLMQFGHGTYGVESAARYFFDKTVKELSVAECALMAGMLQRPGALNPYRYYDRAKARRDLVLRRMFEESVISKEQYHDAVESEIALVNHDKELPIDDASYFVEHVRRNLYDEYGYDIYQTGLKVYTTLDTRVQACANKAIRDYLPELQKVVDYNMRKRSNLKYIIPPSLLEEQTFEQVAANRTLVDSLIAEKCRVQCAFVALDPKTGHVLAMVGGRNFEESEYNRATQAVRQPGSIFKPILYTTAIDNGYMPYYTKLNQPIVVEMDDGSRWTPQNYDLDVGGMTTLREGLRRSLNLISVRLIMEDVPPQQVIRYARNLGLTTRLDPYPTLALGAIGVIPIQMVSAFGVFANKGVLVEPNSILRIEDKYDNIVQAANPESRGVLSEETAYIMADMLKTVASRGTGAASRSRYKFMHPAGGKTGTTNDFTDAWYVTFTPNMVAGVWVGLDDPQMSLGNRQSGAKAALPITAPFMKAVHDTLHIPMDDFEKPSGVVEVSICSETGDVATEFCPNVIKDICNVAYLPTDTCNVHTGERDVTRPQNNNTKRRIRF